MWAPLDPCESFLQALLGAALAAFSSDRRRIIDSPAGVPERLLASASTMYEPAAV
jgi:hypothetical protein